MAAMKSVLRHENPNDSTRFIEVRYMAEEPGGLVTVVIGDLGVEARWTMSAMLAADLVAALGKGIAETLSVQQRPRGGWHLTSQEKRSP